MRVVVSALVASWVAGCATDRLDAAPPSGVNLTGNWQLNVNLSDDPDKLGPDPDQTAPQHAPGTHHGHGGGGRGGGGGGMPPMGGSSPDGIGSSPDGGPGSYESSPRASTGATGFSPTASTGATGFSPTASTGATGFSPTASTGAYEITSATLTGDFQRVALTSSDAPPSSPGGTTPSAPSGKPSRGASINRLLRAPLTMSITQDKGSITVKTNMPDGAETVDIYTAGTTTTIPFGNELTAERTAGWRGPVFVVTTAAKKFGEREDDFAIDTDDGRLIMTTQTKGGKLGKVAITRVYDRVRQ